MKAARVLLVVLVVAVLAAGAAVIAGSLPGCASAQPAPAESQALVVAEQTYATAHALLQVYRNAGRLDEGQWAKAQAADQALGAALDAWRTADEQGIHSAAAQAACNEALGYFVALALEVGHQEDAAGGGTEPIPADSPEEINP